MWTTSFASLQSTDRTLDNRSRKAHCTEAPASNPKNQQLRCVTTWFFCQACQAFRGGRTVTGVRAQLQGRAGQRLVDRGLLSGIRMRLVGLFCKISWCKYGPRVNMSVHPLSYTGERFRHPGLILQNFTCLRGPWFIAIKYGPEKIGSMAAHDSYSTRQSRGAMTCRN